jgi:hypothetical protein
MKMDVDFDLVDLRKHVNYYVSSRYMDYANKTTDEGKKPMEIWRVSNNMHQLLAMHYFMQCFNDERYVVDWWFYEWPDGADDDFIFDIATDEDAMTDMLRCFLNILEECAVKKNDMGLLSYVCAPYDPEKPIKEEDE